MSGLRQFAPKTLAVAAGLVVPLLGLIVLLVWTSASASAQPAITNLAVDSITHSSARVTFTASPAVNRQIAWDTKAYWDANHSFRYKTSRFDNFQTAQTAVITGLTPGTAYYACPLVCDAGANCIACAEGDPKTEFTTSAEPGTRPVIPALPDLDTFKASIAEVPAADATLNVASNCSDLQAQVTAAASATYNNQTVHVVIPAGTTCSIGIGGLALPAKSGSGWVVIRSGGNLPPFGTRFDPGSYSDQTAIFSNTIGSGGNYPFNTYSGAAHHYWFSGIELTHPPIASENDVAGTAGYQRTLLTIGEAAHDFVFERCWFRFRGYPDRGLIAVLLSGGPYNFAFLDSYFQNASIWRAYQSGIAATHTTAAKNDYSGGTVYFGNANSAVEAFSVELSGSGTGAFRLYVERDGDVIFKHNIASGLTATCTGCTSSYDAKLAVPTDALKLMGADDSGNTAITNAQFKTAGGAATGNPWTVQEGPDSGAGWEGSFDLYLNDTHHLLVRNNYLGATGISVYSESGVSAIHDLEFTRNTFQSDPDLFVKTAGDSNRIGVRRQHFELKSGHTVLVEGNQFLDAWVGVSGVPSSAIYLANRGGTIMHDVTIKNNLIVKHPSCFQFFGTEPAYQHSPLLYNLLVENNVCEADAYARRLFLFTAPYDGGMRGHQIEALMGGEDWTFRHNTFYGGLGGQPSLLRLTDNFFEGLTVQDNIFFLQQSELGASWGKGLQSRTVYANAAGVPAIGASAPYAYGEAALNEIAIRVPSSPSWIFDHNVIVAGCTSAAACVSGTTDLLNVASEMDAYPSGNFWPTGATYGERIAAVGFSNSAKADYRLSADSPFRAGGPWPASDNRDVGALYDELESRLGLVTNVRISDVGRRAAIMQYTAPDGAACTVEYGTSAGSGLTRVNDQGGPRQRQVVMAGLAPATQYSYKIMCATQQPAGSFWTQAGTEAPTTIPLRLLPPGGLQISEALVEYGPTNALGSTTPAIGCGQGCAIDVPVTGGDAVYHRVVYRGEGQTVIAQGAIRASIGH